MWKTAKSPSLNAAIHAVLCAFPLILLASAPTDDSTPRKENEGRIRSVLVPPDEVFASTARGLYRAAVDNREWESLPLDEHMPPGGFFAQQPPTATPIYYFTPKWTARTVAEANEKVFGLYRANSSGESWELRSTEYDFNQVYVHDDGVLYAIVAMTKKISREQAENIGPVWISEEEDERGQRTVSYDRIRMSTDSGRNWRDISHGIGRGMSLCSLFPDPDHKDLVCIVGNSVREYVLQASDKEYEWQMTRAWDWWPDHETEETFFRSSYSTRSTLFLHSATLSNYFDFPFGSRTDIPAFQIVTDESHAFDRGERVVIPVEVRFLPDRPTVRILDMDGQVGFWGLRRILPDGTREGVAAAIGWSVYKSKSREETKAEIRLSPALATHVLEKGRPYRRSLDISALCDFPRSGTYRVQLIYQSNWIADKEKGEWPGSFSSPVFEIKVTD